MHSVEDKLSDEITAGIERWRAQPPSQLLDHERDCCRMARAWFHSLDYSFDSVVASADRFRGPRWIRDRYPWGPSRWPLSWCEVVEAEELDCGALTALAREVFTTRGVLCWPAQLVQRFSMQDTQHWRTLWGSGPGLFEWTAGDLIYHEAAAVVVRDRSVKIWDPTHNWWIPPEQADGYGATLLVRVSVPDHAVGEGALGWGSHRLRPNAWEAVADTRVPATPGAACADGQWSDRQLSPRPAQDAGRVSGATVCLDPAGLS
jgi:hypothetical protein